MKKRKAQNRAAQRAFRERKEKHLKDLETKVAELEQSSENANQKNSELEATVERLQMELKEYRKRLSLQSSLDRSPQSASLGSFSSPAVNQALNAFNFDFPRFGTAAVPYGPIFNNTSTIHTSPQSTSLDFGSPSIAGRTSSTDGASPGNIQVATPATSESYRSFQGSVSMESPRGSTSNSLYGTAGGSVDVGDW